MLTSFIVDNQTVYVYLAEDKARSNETLDAFVMSIENMYQGLHCDNILYCYQCPIVTKCGAHRNKLPYYLITTYHQQWVSDHPEYFI